MTDAIADAIDQLNRHRGLTRVSAPRIQGADTLIEIDVGVELPSRSRAEGVSATSVRATETCLLVFPSDWPLSAPRAFLREDFPLDLPHINPHQAGQPVSPCLFEGSLDEVLHRFGLDAIVDQLITWLHKASAGSLIDLEQGWEPTRRDSCPSTVVFSAENVAAVAPEDGSPLMVGANYVTMDGGLYARLDHKLTAQTDPIFDQISHNDQLGKWGGGHAAVFIARAAKVSGRPHIIGHYQPETVVDLSTLLNRSAELGIGLDSLSDYEVAAAVGNSMFADLTSVAGSLYKFGTGRGLPGKTVPRRIAIHADEFNELIGDEFIPLLNKAGGAGFQVTAYTQTWSDVEARIGSRAKAGQIAGNFNTLIMLRVKEMATAELLTSQLPEVRVVSTLVSSSVSDTNDPGDFADFASRNEDRITTESAQMLSPSDLVQLPKGQAFALIHGGQLHKIRMPLPDASHDPLMPASLEAIGSEVRGRMDSRSHWARHDETVTEATVGL